MIHLIKKNDKVILLLRHPADFVFYRLLDRDDNDTHNFQETIHQYAKKEWEKYKQTILECENWDNVLVIKYHAMVLNTHNMLKTALDFIGESDDLLENYIQNIDSHKEECVHIYTKKQARPSGSHTNPFCRRTEESMVRTKELVEQEQNKMIRDFLFDMFSFGFTKERQ